MVALRNRYKMSKTVMIGIWVDPAIRDIVKQIAAIKGVSVPEYIRQLIDQDLDKRTVFTDQLKANIVE